MNTKYRTEQDIHISGWECGTEIELRMVVNFTVHPGCAQTLESPAEEATVEVNEMQFFEMKNGKPSPDAWSLSARIFTAFEDSPGFNEWLLSDAADQNDYALEQAADERREDMRMESRP